MLGRPSTWGRSRLPCAYGADLSRGPLALDPAAAADSMGTVTLSRDGAVSEQPASEGLRAILEQAMLDIMYDVPYREGVKECKITEGVILNKEAPLLSFEKEKKSA